MPLFEFRLTPVDRVEPWEAEAGPNLHWFGLTEGTYWLDIGGRELYRYTEAILRRWGGDQPHVDYQVSRLYEDVTEIAPFVLEPVPGVLGERLDVVRQRIVALWQTAKRDDTDASRDRACAARLWLGNRTLSAGHLRHGPRIEFVRVGDVVHVHCDNRDRVDDGVPMWDVGLLDATLPIDAFLAELRSFHDRLMTDMAQRIEVAAEVLPARGVAFDIGLARAEQAERSRWADPIPTRTDWPAVLTQLNLR
jgi:hypothetical protein